MPRKLVFTDNDTSGVAEVPWRLDRDPTSEELDKIYEALKAHDQFVKPVGLLGKIGTELGNKMAELKYGKENVPAPPPTPWTVGKTVKEVVGPAIEAATYLTPAGRMFAFGIPAATTAISGLAAIPTTLLATAYGAAKKYLTGDESISPLDIGLQAGTKVIEAPHKIVSKIPIAGEPISYVGKAVHYPFELTGEKVKKETKKTLDKHTTLSESAKESLSEGVASAVVNVGTILGAVTGHKVITEAKKKYNEYRSLARENLSRTPEVNEILRRINEAEDANTKVGLMKELNKKITDETLKLIKKPKYHRMVKEKIGKIKEEEARRVQEEAAASEAGATPETVPQPEATLQPEVAPQPRTVPTEPISVATPAGIVPSVSERSAFLTEQLRMIDELIAQRFGEDYPLFLTQVKTIKEEINTLKSQLSEDFKTKRKSYYRMVNGLKKKGVEEAEAVEKARSKYGDIPKLEEVDTQIKNLETQLKDLMTKKGEPIVPSPEQPIEPSPISKEPVLPETQQYVGQLRDPILNAYDLLSRGVPREKVEEIYPEIKSVGESIAKPGVAPATSGEIVKPAGEYNVRERVKFGEQEAGKPVEEVVKGEESRPTPEAAPETPQRPTEPVRPTPEQQLAEPKPSEPVAKAAEEEARKGAEGKKRKGKAVKAEKLPPVIEQLRPEEPPAPQPPESAQPGAKVEPKAKPSKAPIPQQTAETSTKPKAGAEAGSVKPVEGEDTGTTLYTGSDPVAAVKSIKEVIHDIEQALPRLEDLGWALYGSGKQTAKEWVASMKSHLGDMWEQSKGHLQDIWNRVNERARRDQLYSNVDEKINQEPMNSPDVVEKQMTGKVSKPTNPNISIDDLLKSEQVQNIMGDVQGSNTLETIRRIDDFVRLYLKNKDSKFPVQPLDPRKYFGGAWGTVRKSFIHFLTVMDKFGVKAEGVREMIAEMDAKAMVISKYYKELENVFTMHPDKVLKVLDFIAEERVKGTRGMIPDKELVQRGFAPEEVELYKTVRRATASMVDEIRDALLANIKLPEGYSMPKNTTDAKALLDAVSKNPEAPKTLVRDVRLIHEINRIADLEKDLHYVPFSRYGKYYVAVKDSSGKVQRLEFYDKKKQAEMREAELRLEHAGDPKTANWRVYSGKNEKPKLAMTYQLTPTTIMFTRHVLEKFHEMGVMNKDLAALYDDLSTIMRKWGDKFPAHLVKAEMVPGWSKDYIRSFASYIQGMGTFVANAKYANRVREAIAKLDPVTDRPLINWMEQKYAFLKSRSSMTSGINRFLFSYYLAGNVKSALINTLQHLNSVAYSTKWISGREALKTHALASRYAGEYLIGKREGIPADVLDIIDDLKSRGRVSAEAIETLAGIAESKMTLTNDAVRALSIGFRKAEEFNRIHAVVTGYQIAKKLKLDKDGTIAFIERFINDTQYEYSKLGAPLIAQNPIIRPFWAFRTYTYNWMRVMKNLLQEKQYKTFVAMLTPLYALGGLTAVPFTQDILSAIRAVTGFDLYTYLREKEIESGGNGEAADMVVYGVPAFAFGAAIGASLNPFELPNIGTRTSLEEVAAQAVMGAAGGLYQRAKRSAIMMYRYGDIYRAVENIMPEFVRNLMVPWRWKMEKGARGVAGEPYAENMTPWELTLRALGIQPVRYLKGLEKAEIASEISEAASSDTEKVNRRIAEQIHLMMSTEDEKEKAEAAEKIQNIVENIMVKNLEYAEKGEYHRMIIPDERTIKMNVLRRACPDLYHVLKAPQKARPEVLRVIQVWADNLGLSGEDIVDSVVRETGGSERAVRPVEETVEEEVEE